MESLTAKVIEVVDFSYSLTELGAPATSPTVFENRYAEVRDTLALTEPFTRYRRKYSR